MMRFVQYFGIANVCEFYHIGELDEVGNAYTPLEGERACLYRLLNSHGIFTIDCDP